MNAYAQEQNQLTMSIPRTEPRSYSSADATVQVTFRNQGEQTMRLLNLFEPVPVFFAVRVVRPDGSVVPNIPIAGKIDPVEPIPYRDLKQGESLTITLPLYKVLPKELVEGDYEISVVYKNQYGADCFRGTLTAEPVTRHIVPGTPVNQ